MMRSCLPALLLLTSLTANAATPLTADERAVINFGFATQLGSGIYSLSGRTLQVYRLPFAYALPAAEDARVRARLTLPVTLGFVDFEPRDVIDSGLPTSLGALSFVPGLALDIAVQDDWELEPFAEAGIARDHANDVQQNVYSVGLRSRYDFRHGPTEWELYEELVHVVVEQKTIDQTDDFTRLRIGTTARRPFDTAGIGRRPDFLAYGFVELYTDSPATPADGERTRGGGVHFEVGLTFGATERLRLWRIPLPRIGLGYGFGNGLSVYRLVFGSPY